MQAVLTDVLDVMSLFVAGRGAPEHNLVRFGLAGLLWACLLFLAWDRKRRSGSERETMLILAFSVGLAHSAFMFGVHALSLFKIVQMATLEPYFPPVEHMLSQLSVVLVAAGFIGYLRDDWPLARRYGAIAAAVTVGCYVATAPVYARMSLADPALRFGQTWCDWLFRISAVVLIAAGIYLGRRAGGWMKNLFLVAMAMFFLDEALMLINLAQGDVYKEVWGPIRHSLHLAAIPVLGYVYFREESDSRAVAERRLEATADYLRQRLLETIQAIGTIAEMRDPYVAEHAAQATRLGQAIALKLRLDKQRRDVLWMASQLYDVGKVGIPGEILGRPGPLTPEERRIVEEHPILSQEILRGITFDGPVVQVIVQHHERPDGHGYPKGLAGDDVMLEARILAVADAASAMLSHRPYRPALGLGETVEQLRSGAGSAYDADVVDACVGILVERGRDALATEIDAPAPVELLAEVSLP